MDSDINQADQALNVEFFDGTILQNYLSEQEGRPIYHDAVFVRIQTPGNDHNIIVRPVEERDKKRFPLHWAHYKNNASNEQHPGTPLSELPGLTKSAVLNLKARGFHTVEQFAGASDQIISSLGMSAGVSPHAFRDQCNKFLGAAADMAPVARNLLH